MAGKTRNYAYLVDRLDKEKAEAIRKSLHALNHVEQVSVDVSRNTVELQATRDLEQQVRMACDIAKADYRTRVKE